ncbi:MAG: V-type ATPase subunit [Ruminococcus flavefaciens]|nr:V-type ATPase subunit [Ruminococcus flavefaciens]
MGTEYAGAVSAVRAMENSLFTHSDLEQLINARTQNEFDMLISSKDTGGLAEVWDMLRTYAPDSRELGILLYRNDFHNLKAVLKAMISSRDPDSYFIEPSNVSPELLKEAFRTKNSDILPDYMRETATSAYELLTRTLDGQLADTLIDTSCMTAMQRSAEDFGGEFIRRYVQIITVCADIKTAYRCSKMNRQRAFLESAICGSSELDKETLIRATLGGTESLLSFLEHTPYSELALLLKESPALFEKRCDDMLIELAEEARMKAFGADPLIAYYLAKEAEIKNLRIISVCRESGADVQTITERLRKLYV